MLKFIILFIIFEFDVTRLLMHIYIYMYCIYVLIPFPRFFSCLKYASRTLL